MLNEKLNKASKCLAIKFQTLKSFPRITNASGAPFHLSSDRSGNPILKYDFTGNEITSKQSFASCLSCISFFRNTKVLGFIDLPRLRLPKWGRFAHRCVLEEVNRRKRCPNNICKYIGICADQQCSSTEIFILYMIFTKYLPTKLCSW